MHNRKSLVPRGDADRTGLLAAIGSGSVAASINDGSIFCRDSIVKADLSEFPCAF
jgi:hypothetical protein